MRIAFTFRHVEPSDAIKTYATEKIARIQKYLRSPMEVEVTMSLNKHHHRVDVSIHSDGKRYAGSSNSEDMYASIDTVIDKLDRQVRDDKAATVTSKRHSKTQVRG